MTPAIAGALEALKTAHRIAGAPLLTVTSWYRDASRNLAVGGAMNSLHLQGLAFDLRADAGGMAVYRAWRSMGLAGLDERETSAPHWHVSYVRG